MTSKSKAKGNGFERQLVKEFQEAGLEAKRAWGSNGNAMGEHEEVDVVTYVPTGEFDRRVPPNPFVNKLKIQCKRRKKFPKVFALTEHVDATVFREDNGASYILMRLKDFIKGFLKC